MATKKYGKSSEKKIAKVMHEWKKGSLRSGKSDKKVKDRRQAIAIAISEARRAGGKVPPEPKKGGRKAKSKSTKKK